VDVDAIQNQKRQSLTSRLRAKTAIPKWQYRPHFSNNLNFSFRRASSFRDAKKNPNLNFLIQNEQ
jgi:hypothetical protein